jgi:TPR repeat protein
MGGDNDGDKKPEIGAIHTRLHEDDGARASRALKPGELFANRYVVEALIGEGGSGSVYRVHDRTAETEVALKLLRTDRLVTPGARKSLIREALLARNIRHPNIVAVYDVGDDDGQPYIAMEHLPGRSLRAWIREHASGEAQCAFPTAMAIVLAVLDGLDAAHQQNVVHRDLKPENIFLVEEPSGERVRLKLLDFGIAYAAGEPASQSATGHSAYYVAPEMITAPDTVKASADLYSVSVIFYELLIGVLPHRWRPPSRSRSDVPAAIDDLIEAGLDNSPRGRPQSVAAMREKLLTLVKPAGKAKAEPEAPGAEMVAKADKLYADGWGFGGEYPEARDNYYMAAVLGNVAGMIGSAKMLARGHGGPGDERMARAWLTKAAELGSKEAIQRLARFDELLAEGKASAQSQPQEARPKTIKPASKEKTDAANTVFDEMFGKEPAAKKTIKPRTSKPAEPKSNDPVALRKEADSLYQNGKGTNLPRARELFRQAAELGDVEAMGSYAFMLVAEQGGPLDRETAHRWYMRAAEAGNMIAANNVARNFAYGLGVAKDEVKARYWLEKAAERDHAPAMTDLGVMMRNGQGGPKNLEGARHWLKKASERRESLASQTLGLMWHNGEGGPKDLAQAREYHRRAAEGGLAAGQLLYGIYLQNGYGGPENKAEAREWFRKAADNGATNAIAYYGLMLDRGEGGPKDPVTARAWLKRSSEAGDKLGMFGYGLMLMNGGGGAKHETAAREWLKKSGDNGMTDAYAYYAQLLYEGRGGARDKVQAKHYAKLAADAGSETGKKLLQRFW